MKNFEVPVYFDVEATSQDEAWEKINNVLQAQLENDGSWFSYFVEEPIEYDPETL